eukprot:Awhi_evm1s2108
MEDEVEELTYVINDKNSSIAQLNQIVEKTNQELIEAKKKNAYIIKYQKKVKDVVAVCISVSISTGIGIDISIRINISINISIIISI